METVNTNKRRRLVTGRYGYIKRHINTWRRTSSKHKKKTFTDDDQQYVYALHLLGIDEYVCPAAGTFESVIGVTGEAFFNYVALSFLFYGEMTKDTVFICNRRNNTLRIIDRNLFTIKVQTVFERMSEIAEFLDEHLPE